MHARTHDWTFSADRHAPGAHPGQHAEAPAHGTKPLVETIGIEPMTPCLQSRCSPS